MTKLILLIWAAGIPVAAFLAHWVLKSTNRILVAQQDQLGRTNVERKAAWGIRELRRSGIHSYMGRLILLGIVWPVILIPVLIVTVCPGLMDRQ